MREGFPDVCGEHLVLFIDIDLNCDPSCIHTMTVKSLEELKIMLYFSLLFLFRV